MSAPEATLHLYRHILKAAKYFPSRKRDSIIREIKASFRDNKVRGGGHTVWLSALCANWWRIMHNACMAPALHKGWRGGPKLSGGFCMHAITCNVNGHLHQVAM